MNSFAVVGLDGAGLLLRVPFGPALDGLLEALCDVDAEYGSAPRRWWVKRSRRACCGRQLSGPARRRALRRRFPKRCSGEPNGSSMTM